MDFGSTLGILSWAGFVVFIIVGQNKLVDNQMRLSRATALQDKEDERAAVRYAEVMEIIANTDGADIPEPQPEPIETQPGDKILEVV